jgi:hypothetical protein
MSVEKSMTRQWARIVFVLGVVGMAPRPAYSQHVDRNSKPISLDGENLTNLRDSPMAKGVKEGFCTAIKAPVVCPDCVDNFMGAHLYRKVLKDSFLLVDSEENDFGGYFMLVVFKAHWKVYRLWVYRLSSGEFQLREMTPFITLNKALMDELGSRHYFPYWLSACNGT